MPASSSPPPRYDPAVKRLMWLRESIRIADPKTYSRSVSFFDDPHLIAQYAANDPEFGRALDVLFDHHADWLAVLALTESWAAGE